VGPISKSGAREAIATFSMRSMILLNAAFRVAMPDFKNSRLSLCSLRKRDAMRSYFDRSRSMML
jgi:hypothetical protein